MKVDRADYMKKYWLRNKEILNARGRENNRWVQGHALDIIELLRRNKRCVCCDNTPAEMDHIIPTEFYRSSKGKCIAMKRGSPLERLRQVETGNIQFLCEKCNKSKGDSDTCHIHSKYLGLWNHLPVLDDLEAFQ